MSEYTIDQLEKGIEDAEHLIKRREAAINLYSNAEFKLLFVEGFFKEEAARLVQLSGDPSMTQEQRNDALAMAQASGHVRRYLSTIVTMGNTAEKELPLMKEAIDEIRSEENEE